MPAQTTDTILMIRPVKFAFNEQTAVNNYYQTLDTSIDVNAVQEKALQEFDELVSKLKEKGVEVIVIEDTTDPYTPDSIFPNNWVSFHESGKVVLYPMFAENRRKERREDIIELLQDKGFAVTDKLDFTHWEREGKYMEGTGSLVLDSANEIAYAALSERTNKELVELICGELGCDSVQFTANHMVDGERLPIYHTNVMMCVADKFAVICLDAVDDIDERQELIEIFEEFDKEIIELSEEQLKSFVGNMLQVRSKNGKQYMVMSSTAYNALNDNQIETISTYCDIIHSPLDTIETLGGGSARCMMAEVFLPNSNK